MEKYLFNDGTNVIREAERMEELQALIQSSVDPAKVRIWIFNTSEWVSIDDFNKRSSRPIISGKKITSLVETAQTIKPVKRPGVPPIMKKVLIGLVAAVIIFLVYNFTQLTWKKALPLTVIASRPVNTPPVNVDSIIEIMEFQRGQKLDKITKTNLRIRNTWPDLLQLQLAADRDSSRQGFRFYHLELSADNSTGYNIDNAVVKWSIWKNNAISSSDTIHFTNISYASPAKKELEGIYRGDSISVSFISIKSKAFNFCYSSDKKSNYGNYNDRWFCRE